MFLNKNLIINKYLEAWGCKPEIKFYQKIAFNNSTTMSFCNCNYYFFCEPLYFAFLSKCQVIFSISDLHCRSGVEMGRLCEPSSNFFLNPPCFWIIWMHQKCIRWKSEENRLQFPPLSCIFQSEKVILCFSANHKSEVTLHKRCTTTNEFF